MSEVKKIGLGFIFGWLIGLFVILYGIGNLLPPTNSVAGGIFSILAGLMLIPTLWTVIENKLKFTLSTPLRIFLFLVLSFIGLMAGVIGVRGNTPIQ